MESKAIIIGYTEEPDRITSSGARISTTAGNSLQIFENSVDEKKNAALIKKVLSSGHKSIIEHIYFNIAFVNVSAYVEQFMLEFRLASFTVKSRRYVNFTKMGYVIPDFIDERGNSLDNDEYLRHRYIDHMDYLFSEYGSFVDLGIPKEDARFLLPYSYKSNFYCTVNARELANVIYSMVFGRGKENTELRKIGIELQQQARKISPYIFEDISLLQDQPENKYEHLITHFEPEELLNYSKTGSSGGVELLSYTNQPELVVARAALIQYTNIKTDAIESRLKDRALVSKIIKTVISNRRPRELEQINLTFRINNVSLAVITHLTRHRIQSILIPPFQDVCRFDRFLIPDTVKADKSLLERYKTAYIKTKELYEYYSSIGMSKYETVYLFLSGNVLDVTTTMNARELAAFVSLRSCNRTQLETRAIAVKMLNLAREVSPEIFCNFGPRCFMLGKCPEGKMTCGKESEMRHAFKKQIVSLEPLNYKQ